MPYDLSIYSIIREKSQTRLSAVRVSWGRPLLSTGVKESSASDITRDRTAGGGKTKVGFNQVKHYFMSLIGQGLYHAVPMFVSLACKG